MNRTRFLLALSIALVLGPGCKGGKDDKTDEGAEDSARGDDDDSAKEEEDERVAVRVVDLGRGSISERIATSSTVDSDQRADILVETSGTVQAIYVEEGAVVRAGETLAVLKNPQLKGEFDRASASFDRAREEYESLKALVDKGFVARSEYEAAAHAFDTARLTFEQARAGYGSRELQSPIAGTVSMRDLRFGEAVAPPKLAFQVVDMSRLKVDVNLPEKDLARVAAGQEARIRTEILAGVQVKGHVARISPVVDPRSGTVKVTVAVDASQRELRPGMFVNVDIVVETHDDAVLLPKRAIVYTEGRPNVFLAVSEGEEVVAQRRSVTLGFAEEDRVELLDGAAPGDRVVVVGQSTLRDGAKVRVHQPTPADNAKDGTGL